MRRLLEQLVAPSALHAWADLEHDADKPPRCAGTYAWFFDPAVIPDTVPMENVRRSKDGAVLLYIGIAPSKPSPNRPPSRKTLRSRLRSHFRGNARGSTLRLSLGCLLGDQLGIEPVRSGSGDRVKFGAGEALISAWMARHARVCWVENEQPWELEDHAIETLDLPLNLAGNQRHPFHATLSGLRRRARLRASGVTA